LKEDKVRSVKFYVMVSIMAVLISSLLFVFFIDLTFPNLDQDFKRKLNQAGTAINILAALFLSYKFIQSERYQKRERIIYEEHKDMISMLKLAKHNIHDQLLLSDLGKVRTSS
jgi:amino acid permease